MGSRNTNIFALIDKPTVIIYLILIFWGWFTIYAASYNFDDTSIFSFDGRAGKQLLWIGCASIIAFIIMMFDTRLLEAYAYPIYGVTILILILTIFIAPNVKGSHSWIVLGPVSIQPAEFSKFAVALCLARFMSAYNFVLKQPSNFIRAVLIIFIPLLIIILQKETGTALVYLAFSLVLFREGMTGLILLACVASITYFILALKYAETFWGITCVGELLVLTLIVGTLIMMTKSIYKKRGTFRIMSLICIAIAAITGVINIFIPVNWVYALYAMIATNSVYTLILSLKTNSIKLLQPIAVAIVSILFMFSVNYIFNSVLEPHQQSRIKVSFGMEDDPRGVGYNVNQSKIAIGSGGFFGKGYLSGTQTKLKYVPEQDTDFIFCTVGEELGFVGSTILIALFVALILRIITISERQRDAFGRIYGYCVASIFIFHLCINVGMVLGISPVIGIPLPFFSYGGSSLWGFTILLFTLLRIDASRTGRI
ncbi:MAG: rod shape-determining protein RodA [Muribaculaceae bacterium]|nr:rod shape-determining protein RodA [Muribaculaceae bacterium]